MATASSANANMGPERTMDGSGLNALDQHSTEGTDMWLSAAGDQDTWIQYAFDRVYKLDEMWIWNYAEGYKDGWSYSKQAIQNCNIKYTSVDSGLGDGWGSYDSADWTEIYAADLADYDLGEDILPNNIIDFGGAGTS